VVVPPFEKRRPAGDRVRSNAVHLYFEADGSVAAQRVQEIGMGEDKFAVRFTKPAPALKAESVCGTVADAYDASFKLLAD
jgi:hypothetical protein